MRHQVGGKKLNRDSKHRSSLLKTLMKQLIANGYITTTEAKSKVLKQAAEKLLNKAKESTLAVRRQIISELGDVKSAHQAIDVIMPKISQSGGFITSQRMGRRLGDNAMMVKLELPKIEVEEKKEEKAVKTASKAKKEEKTK